VVTVRTTLLWGAVVGAVALALGVAAVALGESGPGTSDARPSERLSSDPMAIFDASVPLMPDGQQVTLRAVVDAAGFPIPRPAALGEPSEVWLMDYGGGVHDVGLRYADRGITIHLARFPDGRRHDLDAWAEARVEGLPLAYTTTIAGYPAAVLPYDPGRAVAPIDVVYVAVGDVEVTIYGDHGRTNVEELLSAAATLAT
jgi:hypothetical protein